MNLKVKFILTYVAGIVTGIVLLFVVGFFMAKSQATSASNDDVVMFEKPRGIVPGKVFAEIATRWNLCFWGKLLVLR